jgi:phage terminase large subunit-like protein
VSTTRSPKSTSSPVDEQLAELDAFARFCSGALTIETGEPFELEPFQRLILEDYFAGSRELVVLLPKKNGKSSLVAALALWHLLATPFAEAIIVAAARDQAGIILRQVTGFIRRSPQLKARLKVVLREVRNDELDGRLRVLASDSDTVDGQIPTFVAVDELHRHKRAELYGILRDGLGARDGQMVAISTAGDDENSPLGRLRAEAYALPSFVKNGAHRYATTGSFTFHEWALDADDDVHDLALVKTANPLSGVTLEELEQRHDSPSMAEWMWKRFAAGVWAMGEFGAFEPHEWAACSLVPFELPEGMSGPYIGVDLGLKWDTTAIVPVWVKGGGWVEGRREVHPGRFLPEWVRSDEPPVAYVGAPVVLVPPRDGSSLSVDVIFDACADMAERWPDATFVLDPLAGGEQLAQRLDAELDNVRVTTYSQANAPMQKASMRLAAAITAGRLWHAVDPTLTAHVLACGVRQIGEGWRLAKQPGSSAPIDAAVACAMALSAGMDDTGGDEPPKVPPGGYRVLGLSY